MSVSNASLWGENMGPEDESLPLHSALSVGLSRLLSLTSKSVRHLHTKLSRSPIQSASRAERCAIEAIFSHQVALVLKFISFL